LSNISPTDLTSILAENDSERTQLVCGRHNYTPLKKRSNGTVAIPPNTRGCKECWFAYYAADLALTPPNKRQERLDELEEVIHHAVEFERTGRFDFVPDVNPTIRYHKDAADDLTGEDKKVIITDTEEEVN
jgi:hypothetical protein